jgi:hypothetical protein
MYQVSYNLNTAKTRENMRLWEKGLYATILPELNAYCHQSKQFVFFRKETFCRVRGVRCPRRVALDQPDNFP